MTARSAIPPGPRWPGRQPHRRDVLAPLDRYRQTRKTELRAGQDRADGARVQQVRPTLAPALIPEKTRSGLIIETPDRPHDHAQRRGSLQREGRDDSAPLITWRWYLTDGWSKTSPTAEDMPE